MIRKEIIEAGTSGAVQVISNILDLGNKDKCSVHVIFSGGGNDLAGSLVLEASNDGQNWEVIEDSTQTVTGSNNHMYNLAYAHYNFLRVNWSPTGGTGEIKATAVIKETEVRQA